MHKTSIKTNNESGLSAYIHVKLLTQQSYKSTIMLKKINDLLPEITLSLRDQAEQDKGNNPFNSFIDLIIRITV